MEVSYGSNPLAFVYDHLEFKVISITNYCDLGRFPVGSHDEGVSSRILFSMLYSLMTMLMGIMQLLPCLIFLVLRGFDFSHFVDFENSSF